MPQTYLSVEKTLPQRWYYYRKKRPRVDWMQQDWCSLILTLAQIFTLVRWKLGEATRYARVCVCAICTMIMQHWPAPLADVFDVRRNNAFSHGQNQLKSLKSARGTLVIRIRFDLNRQRWTPTCAKLCSSVDFVHWKWLVTIGHLAMQTHEHAPYRWLLLSRDAIYNTRSFFICTCHGATERTDCRRAGLRPGYTAGIWHCAWMAVVHNYLYVYIRAFFMHQVLREQD